MKLLIRNFFFILSLLLNSSFVIAGEARIAAAASLTFVLEEITDQFYKETGHRIKISYASSGTLTRQIEQGAPFELFLSADESYIDRLIQQQLTSDQNASGTIYAVGKLAIFNSSDQTQHITSDLSSLGKSLKEKKIKHFSIPDPELAPYGRIAKQALETSGLWGGISPFLITGENASQAAMFVSTGSVDGALLPLSLAMILEKKGLGNYQLVAEDLYQPLKQRMVLLKNTGKITQSFYEYLLQPSAQKIFNKHGFGTVNY